MCATENFAAEFHGDLSGSGVIFVWIIIGIMPDTNRYSIASVFDLH